MADRAEISKVTAYAISGQDGAMIVPKVVAYLLLEPGSDEPDTSIRVSHVYAQKIRRG